MSLSRYRPCITLLSRHLMGTSLERPNLTALKNGMIKYILGDNINHKGGRQDILIIMTKLVMMIRYHSYQMTKTNTSLLNKAC